MKSKITNFKKFIMMGVLATTTAISTNAFSADSINRYAEGDIPSIIHVENGEISSSPMIIDMPLESEQKEFSYFEKENIENIESDLENIKSTILIARDMYNEAFTQIEMTPNIELGQEKFTYTDAQITALGSINDFLQNADHKIADYSDKLGLVVPTYTNLDSGDSSVEQLNDRLNAMEKNLASLEGSISKNLYPNLEQEYKDTQCEVLREEAIQVSGYNLNEDSMYVKTTLHCSTDEKVSILEETKKEIDESMDILTQFKVLGNKSSTKHDDGDSTIFADKLDENGTVSGVVAVLKSEGKYTEGEKALFVSDIDNEGNGVQRVFTSETVLKRINKVRENSLEGNQSKNNFKIGG